MSKFFAWNSSSREGTILDNHFWLDMANFAFFNQTIGFFDQQYIWKESDFLHGDFHQGNVASKTSTFGWVRLGVSDIQYSPKNSSILESPKLFLCFYFDT